MTGDQQEQRCIELVELLTAYLDDNLDPQTRRAFESISKGAQDAGPRSPSGGPWPDWPAGSPPPTSRVSTHTYASACSPRSSHHAGGDTASAAAVAHRLPAAMRDRAVILVGGSPRRSGQEAGPDRTARAPLRCCGLVAVSRGSGRERGGHGGVGRLGARKVKLGVFGVVVDQAGGGVEGRRGGQGRARPGAEGCGGRASLRRAGPLWTDGGADRPRGASVRVDGSFPVAAARWISGRAAMIVNAALSAGLLYPRCRHVPSTASVLP